MDDLISKQAAIDAMIEWYGCEPSDLDYFKKIVEQLPSAQPEIIRCEDCQHANECHKSVQYTRNEPNAITIGYSPIEWCSRGERREVLKK